MGGAQRSLINFTIVAIKHMRCLRAVPGEQKRRGFVSLQQEILPLELLFAGALYLYLFNSVNIDPINKLEDQRGEREKECQEGETPVCPPRPSDICNL